MSTRRALLQGALATALLPATAWTAEELPRPASLAEELRRALAARKALVVMVSLDGCPYCRIVRGSHLLPLRAQGQPVVQVEMAHATPLVDLQGRASSHQQVVRDLGVQVAPTVLFIGRDGREAAPRIAGMPIADFYGAYLQERVDAANRSVA